MVGPRTAIDPTVMAFRLIPMPSLFKGYILRTSPPNRHISMAEPNPWAMRDSSKPSKDSDAAEASEASMNSVIPMANIRRKPMRSATADKRSEDHTSELQSLMRHSSAVLCLKNKNNDNHHHQYVTRL